MGSRVYARKARARADRLVGISTTLPPPGRDPKLVRDPPHLLAGEHLPFSHAL
jgi:hypothetical protein